MNELDFMIRELGCLVIEIEEFDLSTSVISKKGRLTHLKKGDDVKKLKLMMFQKEDKIKKIIEYKKNNKI